MKNEPESKDLLDSDLFAKAYSEALDYKKKVEGENLVEELHSIEERYEVLKLLGEGAVKKVYQAYDRLMDRQVALAQIKNDDENLLNDFINEARLSSTLEHPYIAPVYDLGFSGEKNPYFVMKLYEGRNLKEELDDRRASGHMGSENINWILNIFLKVCEAVSFAHSKGVLHLDIKPSNIRVDDYGEVLLCDWGIARIINSSFSPGQNSPVTDLPITRATLAGEVRGTPGFMAPEQITRENPCDERTDVYGLGALLHDMITGRPPVKKEYDETIKCPEELKAIFSKALSDSQNQRYQSVQSLIQDIEKYQSGMVTSAENAGSLAVLRKWLARNRKAVAVLLINLLVFSVLLVIYIRDIRHGNDRLETIVTQLNDEKVDKLKQQHENAAKYFQQSNELYRNTVSHFDFDPKDNSQAAEMLIRSLELNPEQPEAWALSGRLRTLKHEYELAAEDFKKAGEKYADYRNVIEDFLQSDLNLRTNEGQLYLINKVGELNDARFRNHLIFKNIHQRKNEDLLEFARGAVLAVNKLDSLNWRYDDETKTLDLSGTDVQIIYPIKTLRFAKLNLSHSKFRTNELFNLRRIPLVSLDLSYTSVNKLDRFSNEEVEEMNLEGCPIKDLSRLSVTKIKKLNIYKTSVKAKTLRKCTQLELITCSAEQAAVLKKVLPATVRYNIVNY